MDIELEGLEDELLPDEPRQYKLKLQRWRYRDPVIQNGDTMWCYLLPELPVYAPLKFRTAHQRRAYNRLVYNVKKVLPLAQQVNQMIAETYEVLEQLPDKKSKDAPRPSSSSTLTATVFFDLAIASCIPIRPS